MDKERGHGGSRVFLYGDLEIALAAGIWPLLQLDVIFQINRWGSITNYQKLVSGELESANDMGESLKAANIAVDFCLKKDTISDIVGLLESSC